MLASLAVLNLPAAVGSLQIAESARGALRGGVYGDKQELGFDNLLSIDASLSWPTTVVSLGYGPRFGVARVLDGSLPTQLTLLHDIDAGLQLREGRFSLDLGETVSVGQQSFGQLYGFPTGADVAGTMTVPPTAGGTATPAGQPGASPAIPAGAGDPVRLGSGVQVYSYRSTGRASYLWSRRWESTLDLSYSLQGAKSQKLETVAGRVEPLSYPRIQITDAESTSMYDATHTQRLGGVVGGQHGWSDRDKWGLVSLAGAYSVRWTSHTNLDLRAGAAYRDSRALSDGTRDRSIVPIGAANFTHSIDSHTLRARFLVNVTYEPMVNTLAAVLQDRLTALASASLSTRWDSITLSASGSQSFPTSDPESATFVGTSLSYDHQFSRWVGFEVGGQVVDQVTDNSISTGTLWTVYVGLGAQLSPLRF